MSNGEGQRLIVVKRVKKGGGGHHGGAWKIAYADFVTAMMAFFLLMWLISSTSKATLEGIAEYFKTPIKVAMNGGSSVAERSSVIKGGGTDATRKQGEVRKALDLKAAETELDRQEKQRLEQLKKKLEEAIDANPLLRQFKRQLLIDITAEGLRIQVVDDKNRPMFALASNEMQPYAREILRQIGRTLNDVPNRIGLSGHTDSVLYAKGEKGYGNWELSSERANASRRELVIGGMQDAKVLRVVGLASAVPLDSEHPDNPINRRISIIVLNKRTEDAITSTAGATVSAPDATTVAGALRGAAAKGKP